MATLPEIVARLKSLRDPMIAAHSQGFFKTGKGEYGAGDRFLGIRVPVLRQLVREYRGIPSRTLWALLRSPWHEARLLSLLMLVDRYRRADEHGQAEIYTRYLANLRYVNNWGLVDSSAPDIIGAHLARRDAAPIFGLAASDNLWQRRIAIIATFHFIKHHSFEHTLALAELLLNDSEDLIHKAVGWMLREVGNRDRTTLERFLRRHARRMPRTMLRYAIERLPEARRRAYLRDERPGATA
ncbi:MAG: DNA alkylation repair protein [Steroidobacteraceae bacterium]